jgi:ferredoxin-NADP reductase
VGVIATFLAVYVLASTTATVAYSRELVTGLETLRTSVVSMALVYFAFVMLTDPITVPSGRVARHSYAAFVAVLYATPFFRFLPLTASPEVALCIANAASFLRRPRYRLDLTLVRKARYGEHAWEFDFTASRPMRFRPGQFMEWTVPHPSPDGRGQRRYFTIASSPTEADLKIVVRVPEPCSTYKRALVAAKPGTRVVASRLAGDFTLPRRTGAPLAFLAGGVGIAPFRSMARYIVDEGLRCDVVLLYWCHRPDEFLFADVFDAAAPHGMKTVRMLTGRTAVPAEWKGKVGAINADTVRREVPDYDVRNFYLSGSHPMVSRMHAVLRRMGIRGGRVRKDYFDGLVDSDVPLPRVSVHGGTLAAWKS